MLSTGIKNAILFVLIILILHFLIKNITLEKEKSQLKAKEPGHVLSQESPQQPLSVAAKSPEEKKKELYKYVMDETDIEKFFEPKIIPEPNDAFDTSYDIACDGEKALHDESPSQKKVQKEVKNEANSAFLTIHEYADENALNGGALFDGLNGYDGFGSMYEEYKCGQ